MTDADHFGQDKHTSVASLRTDRHQIGITDRHRRNRHIAKQLSINRKTVILWRKRFAQQRLDGLWEIAPGRGRKPRFDIDKIAAIVDATLQTKPAGMTHWSCRTMGKSQGVSKSTIDNIWQAHNLKPHRVKTFKLSRDPKFLEKLTDVVGLYLNPPQQAIVLCLDEKSQIQALDRTRPGLPLKKGRCGTMTHDYKRNGTTTLFAALETLQGKVIGQCFPRHRQQEFLRFLRTLVKEFPGDVPLHLILDNYGTHKHEKVWGWLQRHPRFETHFVPTSSSWLNLVERWFGELSQKAIRRGAFGSMEELKACIEEFLAAWNQEPVHVRKLPAREPGDLADALPRAAGRWGQAQAAGLARPSPRSRTSS